jgi:hypothetical protein
MGNTDLQVLRERFINMIGCMAVPCSYCHAPIGIDCQSRTGGHSIGFHKKRISMADLLSEHTKLDRLRAAYIALAAGLPAESIYVRNIEYIDKIRSIK